MAVTLHVDYKEIRHWVEEAENAEPIDEDRESRIVNLHANFVIPEEERHLDFVFPHFGTMHAMAEKGIEVGSIAPITLDEAIAKQNSRPYRRPDIGAEWSKLKKAWSLHRRGRDKLATRIVEEASKEFYADDALSGVPDWVWRFALFSTGTEYEPTFRAAIDLLRKPMEDGLLKDMFEAYRNEAADRGGQYHAIIRDYFSTWAEFSQVHFAVGRGIDVGELTAGTAGFAATQMYYGNAFEVFASLVDYLTMANNVLSGRPFNQLANISLQQYRATDKGKRFDAFAGTPALSALCTERDNQLRNASHHREMVYDQDSGTITYSVGKGGSAGPRTMSYAEYLVRCSKLHHQIIVLLRIELLMAQAAGLRYPI